MADGASDQELLGRSQRGRVAIVTGGGRGIGRAIAARLARLGANVVVAGRSAEPLEAVVGELEAEGLVAAAEQVDIQEESSVQGLFERVEERFGAPDILINNAGLGLFGRLETFSVEDLDRIMAVNVRGTFLCCREAVRRMRPMGRGHIINISSVVGWKGYAEQSAYSASKHGIMGLTKSLAREEQEHGIRVSAILPGGVDTELIREARPDLDPQQLMSPDDVADAVAYLLSVSSRAGVDEIHLRRRNSTPF
jgi:3-oxoacyl-[acyl-carrier protein] reductase